MGATTLEGYEEKSKQFMLKFAILGDKQVGKSSLLNRYTKDIFNYTYLQTREGVEVTKVIDIDGVRIQLSIVDSAGQYKMNSVVKSLYRDVHGILLVYDVTRKSTFESLQEWLAQIEMVNSYDPFVVIVGNKCDIESHRKVPLDYAESFAESKNLCLMESSAQTGQGVKEAFHQLILGMCQKKIR
ncbi:unnamed protein product, partial [Lymnaea stagnalis]